MADRQSKTAEGSTTCPSCGSGVQERARFCQQCGRSLENAGWFSVQTLTVAAAAVIGLVALGLLFASVIDLDRLSPDGSPTSSAPTAAVSSGQPPDLSSMSPREAADRLFNRVMMADEQGDSAEVEQFTPMAVAAYEQLENLDADALFHVGLIYTAAGDNDKARDYNERLKAIVPNHLLAALLEHRLAEAEGKTEIAASAAKRFHDHYDEEISVGRPEYQHHEASIERFRANLTDGDAGAN